LVELARQYPRLEIDASFTDRMVDLVAERFDVAIRIGQLPDSTMVARRIAPVRSVVVASPDYLETAGRPRTPSDLARHNCLIYATSSGDDWRFRIGNRWTQIHVGGRFRSDNGETLVQWAVAGLGICNAPSFLVDDAISDGKLERLFEDFAAPEYGMFAVRPSGANPPARVRVLIDSLIERFG
jgi:DNA-binding transcriptional LysR family regulator